jgi:hypothetical protein
LTRIARAITLGAVSALSIAVLGGCAAPMPKMADQQAANEQQMLAARDAMLAATDKLLVDAVKAGKAIVVTTTINLDSKKWGDFNDANVMTEFARARNGITEWRNTDRPDASFKVGNGESAMDMKDIRGSHMQVVFGRSLYQVFIVEPGNYTLAGGTNVIPRTTLSNPAANAKIRRSALGSAVLEETEFTEFEKRQYWRDAAYETNRVQQTVCTSVRVASGQCASTADASYDQTRQTRAAGYATGTYAKEIPGVKSTAQLRKPFASFSVAPGEVVLVDGFYADAPNFSFSEKDCERIESRQIRCEINQYTLIRIPTSLQDFSKTTPAAQIGLPGAGQLFTRMQYREPKIFAKGGSTSNSYWGQEYKLTER